jgi:hypothetical protein
MAFDPGGGKGVAVFFDAGGREVCRCKSWKFTGKGGGPEWSLEAPANVPASAARVTLLFDEGRPAFGFHDMELAGTSPCRVKRYGG